MILELQLLSGKRILRNIMPEKVYDLVQLNRRRWHFCKHFPWIGYENKPYIKFRYQDKYETMRDICDSRLKVDCSIACFMSMLGIKYTSWAESNIDSMIKYGE